MSEQEFMTQKEFNEFVLTFTTGQDEIKKEVKNLNASILGDKFGNKGIVPTVQSHQIQIDNLNKSYLKFEQQVSRINTHDYVIENIRKKAENLEHFRAWVMGAIAMAAGTGALFGALTTWIIQLF